MMVASQVGWQCYLGYPAVLERMLRNDLWHEEQLAVQQLPLGVASALQGSSSEAQHPIDHDLKRSWMLHHSNCVAMYRSCSRRKGHWCFRRTAPAGRPARYEPRTHTHTHTHAEAQRALSRRLFFLGHVCDDYVLAQTTSNATYYSTCHVRPPKGVRGSHSPLIIHMHIVEGAAEVQGVSQHEKDMDSYVCRVSNKTRSACLFVCHN